VYGDLGERRARAARRRARGELNPSYAKAEAGLSLDSYSTARYEELIGEPRPTRAGVAEGGELAHYNLGLAFRQKALYDEALREFRLATERGEDTFLVQQAQAEMLLLRGDSAEALALYRELIEQESASPKLWNELGVARHQAGDSARRRRRTAARWRSIPATHSPGTTWRRAAPPRPAVAEEAFRAAMRAGQGSADVWRNSRCCCTGDGRLQDSTLAYEQALDADPVGARAPAYGILLMDLGRRRRRANAAAACGRDRSEAAGRALSPGVRAVRAGRLPGRAARDEAGAGAEPVHPHRRGSDCSSTCTSKRPAFSRRNSIRRSIGQARTASTASSSSRGAR
jgi:cellulose synthase operon protein C